MNKTILKYILFEDLKNKNFNLLRIIMSILGTIAFVLISFGKFQTIRSGVIEFYSVELLWFYLFITTLLFYRKKITKNMATRIAMGFFSLFSNLFINVWLLWLVFLLLGLSVEILRFATGNNVLNFFPLSLPTRITQGTTL